MISVDMDALLDGDSDEDTMLVRSDSTGRRIGSRLVGAANDSLVLNNQLSGRSRLGRLPTGDASLGDEDEFAGYLKVVSSVCGMAVLSRVVGL